MFAAWPSFSITTDAAVGFSAAAAAACSLGQNSLSRPATNSTGTASPLWRHASPLRVVIQQCQLGRGEAGLAQP